jgi:hypothetical protein
MNDLLQLKKQHQTHHHHQPGTKITIEKYNNENKSSHMNHINQQHTEMESNNLLKLKEKSNHHKRPSISYEISSKRVKGQDNTIKATPQLLQQLITTTGINQKGRHKVAQQQQTLNSDAASTSSRWTTSSAPQQSKTHQPASNSVLMNLLVSGCDVSAGYTCLPRPKVAKA